MPPENIAIGRAVVLLWAGLALLAIVVLAVGGIWLIRRWGSRLRATLRPAQKIVYYDLGIRNSDPPPEPTNGDDIDEPRLVP